MPFNINLLGDEGVGKTAWIHMMNTGEFRRQYVQSFGCNVHRFVTNTSYGGVELNLRDYAGETKHNDDALAKCDATVLMFDLTSNVSHRSLALWKDKCGTEPQLVVANKCDITDVKVQPTFHKKANLPYVALSAKTMARRDFLQPVLRLVTGHDDLVILE